jgi:stage II sporulation protein D
MSSSKFYRLLALVVAPALVFVPLARAQETRPRRAQQFPASEPSTEKPPVETPAFETPTVRLEAEPTIRIGLATGARSATISTAANNLLLASNELGATVQPTPLGVARVRIEPRVFAPLPSAIAGEMFRVEIATVTSEDEARRIANAAQELTGEAPEVERDERTRAWRVRVGTPATRPEAEELRTRLEEAGIATFSVVNTTGDAPRAASNTQRAAGDAQRGAQTSNTSKTGTTQQAQRPSTAPARTPGQSSNAASTRAPEQRTNDAVRNGRAPSQSASDARNGRAPSSSSDNVRLASRASLPTRGLVVYAGGAARLLDARAPVIFASPDERSAPLRFNEKAYRGRIEVFTNLNGALTVVNVVRLEDYVRGVVPNELSPGGYGGVPALESLKAQAVAARTYAVSNRGQFAAAGFDLLPTTRSQVYGGMGSEHPLSSRAVEETRGIVATYRGQPINALYTSTCGGHTEDAENIFGGESVPYLRGRACSIEAAASNAHASTAIAFSTLETTREPPSLREAEHADSPRELALLAVHGFRAPTKLTDDWLASVVTTEDVRALLEVVSRLAHRPLPSAEINADAVRPAGFATALALAVDFESRGTILLDEATIKYLLAFRDADDIPARNRPDVALMLRDGHLQLYPDATLRPRQALTRARALHTVAHLLEARDLFALQKVTARQSAASGILVVRGGKATESSFLLSPQAFIFRAFGATLFQTRAVELAGGEPVTLHTNARGAVDYLEVRPAPAGASAERYSTYTNWTTTLSLGEVSQRLASHTGRVGALTDLRVARRGVSHRALDLEVVGTQGTAHVLSGRIRSVLGLREQLFVIDRRYDEAGRLVGFTFTGRGWGHGVGMCQVGAYGMARAGLSYDKILKHYYTGIELTKMY